MRQNFLHASLLLEQDMEQLTIHLQKSSEKQQLNAKKEKKMLMTLSLACSRLLVSGDDQESR